MNAYFNLNLNFYIAVKKDGKPDGFFISIKKENPSDLIPAFGKIPTIEGKVDFHLR